VLASSKFAAPKFAFSHIEPNLENMPDLSITQTFDAQNDEGMNDGLAITLDEEEERDSIVLEFVSGVRGFCCPEMLSQVARLMGILQAKVAVFFSHYANNND
jgi:hypothetical protein